MFAFKFLSFFFLFEWNARFLLSLSSFSFGKCKVINMHLNDNTSFYLCDFTAIHFLLLPLPRHGLPSPVQLDRFTVVTTAAPFWYIYCNFNTVLHFEFHLYVCLSIYDSPYASSFLPSFRLSIFLLCCHPKRQSHQISIVLDLFAS